MNDRFVSKVHVLGFVGLVLLLGCSLTSKTAHADETSRARAREIAGEVLEAMGGAPAWEGTRFVHWDFMERRRHWWDRYSGDVRVESEDTVVLMNLNDREGRVFTAGQEVTDPDAVQEALDTAYAWWVNDSYWVFMPYKLLDPGVNLDHLGQRRMENGRSGEVLELTFGDVGLTPQNRYEVVVDDETRLVRQWSYFPQTADEEPAFTGPWDDWREFGEIRLATSHGRGLDWDLAVYEDLPRSVFEDPAPVDLD